MKKRAWIADALIGLLLTGFVAGSYLLRGAFLESLELKAYDARAQLRVDLEPSSDVIIVAIDDESISRLGRWPWPRTRLSEMLAKLKAAGPRVIGLDILYTEPELNPALAELDAMKARYLEHLATRQVSQKGVEFEAEFGAAAERLDTDKHLLAALTTTQNVVLPMFFLDTAESRGAKPPELPAALSSSTLAAQLSVEVGVDHTIEATKASYPLPPFIEASAGVGHVNIYPDLDGVVRRETLVVKYGSQFFPSYALALVARSLGFRSDEVTITPGRKVQVGKIEIPLDDEQSMLVTFNGPEHTFRYYPFYEVLEGKIPADVFKDKIVILGPSAQGVGTVYVTPVAKSLPSVEFIANVIENVLNRRFLGRPVWAANAELGAIAIIGLFVMFGLPRLRALGGAAVTVALLAGLFGFGFWTFKVRGEWIKVVYPAFLLGVGYVVIVTKRFFTTERGKEAVEASQVETNKMLGLSFQGQGMLDLAFEKFRIVPKDLVDDSFKDTLYNLGLDFERKRQYSKAVQVYKHIEASDPKFKDITEKIKTLSAAAEGAVFGGVGKQAKEGTVVMGGSTKPMLGRYEIEKELGRGAMGIVYLGKDPKINRQVAIKTLMMDEGASAAEIKEIKERFFREAESAGTLNHPGIVRVFDAGEENDICFIAMELLSGEDLVKYAKKEAQLAPDVAMEYVARIAEALDYAHQQGIVHRDIKPANIMLLKDGSLRVTDFGIARIQASSKTATGTVMGTPSYMSPEQIAGRKVDGRSDLFSLGVTLFELLTTEKPFKGGEGIGALLFQIANDPEPDILTINPSLPRSIKPIISKILAKKSEERYLRGNDLARDLRACIEGLKTGVESAPTPEEIAGSIAMPAPEAAAPIVEIPISAPVEVARAPGIELGARPGIGAPSKAPAKASGIELGPRPGLGAPPPPPSAAMGIELGPRPGLGSPAAPAAPASSFTPEEVAATLSFSMPAELPPAPAEEILIEEPAPVVLPDSTADLMNLVDSIMPQVAPNSLSPADITNPNLKAELALFQAKQDELAASASLAVAEPSQPEAIEPPFDAGDTIILVNPSKPQ